MMKISKVFITRGILLAGILTLKVCSAPHFSYTQNTGNNMTILVKAAIKPSVNEKPLSFGDEIGVFTPDGRCVGGVVWKNNNAAITVWGDNEQTADIDGSKNGETLQFRLWDAKKKNEYPAVVTLTSGNSRYSPDAITILSRIVTKADRSLPASKTADTGRTIKTVADTFQQTDTLESPTDNQPPVRQDTPELKSRHDTLTARTEMVQVNQAFIHSDEFSVSWKKDDQSGNSYSILFSLPDSSLVTFEIHDAAGKRIHLVKQKMPQGKNTISVTTEKLDIGSYSYILETKTYSIKSEFNVK